jgi:hypothetical protein
MLAQRLASTFLLLGSVALGGINWKAVWLEPRTPVILLTVGEAQSYTIMGLDGRDYKSILTRSPYLKITSSDVGVVEIDAEKAAFVAKKPGHAEVQISFSEATDLVPAFVREPKTEAASIPPNAVAGIWRAVFTGPMGERPKMVSEILFDVETNENALTGTVHAAAWPGDGAITDGRVDGDQVTFTMTGHHPFQAGRPGAMLTDFPKLCFTGLRNAGEMKIDLLWTDASRACSDGKLLPMLGKKLAD